MFSRRKLLALIGLAPAAAVAKAGNSSTWLREALAQCPPVYTSPKWYVGVNERSKYRWVALAKCDGYVLCGKERVPFVTIEPIETIVVDDHTS